MRSSEEEERLLSPQSQTAARYDDTRFNSPFGDPEAREKLEKQLLRKLDLRMSILVLIYILNYIDRNSAAAARLRGFEHDLGLEGSQFASIISSLYVGYIFMQIPSNMFISNISRPSTYLSCCTMAWGTISLCTGFVTSYHGALLAWFLLGFAEAAFFPGALFLITKWYKRSELSQRTAALTCGLLISNAFGSLIASGILDLMEGVLGLPAWRWLFITEGGLTVLVAFLSLSTLPDFPESKANWLTPAEHALARLRMIEDAAGASSGETITGSEMPESNHKDGAVAGLLLALADWKVWWLAASLTLMIASFSFSLYFPTLSATMGYNPTITLLLCAPPWIAATVFSLWICTRSDRVGERFMHITIPLGVGLGGFVMAMMTMNTFIRYVSLFFMAISKAGFICSLAWVSSSVSNPPAKRAVALALINCISQFGNIIGSYIWPRSWGPDYNNSYGICIGLRLMSMLMLFIFKKALVRLNREMDAKESGGGTWTQSGGGKKWRYHL